MFDFLKKTKIGAILGDKKIEDAEKEKLLNIAIAQAVTENQNGMLFVSCGLAKGVVLEFLNKLLDESAISHNKYNEYRDMILDQLTPERCESFINDFYLEGEKMWEKRKKEQEEYEKKNPKGDPLKNREQTPTVKVNAGQPTE